MKNLTKNISVLLTLVFAMSFNANSQQIGDIYEGGYIFQINEDSTGLVADLEDLGEMNWDDAMSAAESATSQGYDDWYLPSIEELELIYYTIGNGGLDGNIGGFENTWYWSSSEDNNLNAWLIDLTYQFGSGGAGTGGKANTLRVRVIRAF